MKTIFSCVYTPVLFLASILLFAGTVFSAHAQETITIEAEDAVSTNFAAEPVLLFGAGNNRTLQLQSRESLGGTFYADYAVYAPQSGSFEFWYGGSIPGARDSLLPSYGSPLVLTVNDGDPRTIYWEDVAVGPEYSPPYRWVRAGVLELEAGLNQLRIEVQERRRFDATFFLYLDRLVLREVGGESRPAAGSGAPDAAGTAIDAINASDAPVATGASETPVPAVGNTPNADAPTARRTAPSIDQLPTASELRTEPESIEDLLIMVRDNPEDTDAWRRLASLYTLVGDNINALRYLNRALVINPGDPGLLRLTARNRIWRGDVSGALETYWQLLSADPNSLASFLEAGKIAAWNGFFGASEQYYLAGLGPFPDSVALQVNLAFTYLWWARETQARELFQQVEARATTPAVALQVAREYRVNEDIEQARRFLRQVTTRTPTSTSADLHAARYDLLLSIGEQTAADEAIAAARTAVQDQARLASLVERVDRTYRLRNELIAEFVSAATDDPYNLTPRRTLAQTYFWIGRREEGIREFEHLLAADTVNAMRGAWDGDREPYARAALLARARTDLQSILQRMTQTNGGLSTAVRALNNLGSEPEPAERSAAIAEVDRLSAELERLSELATSIIGFLELADATAEPAPAPNPAATPAPNPEANPATVDELQTEWDAIRDAARWDPDVPQTLSELTTAEGVLPGVGITASLVDWLTGDPDVAPPATLISGSASSTEQLLLVWSWGVSDQPAATNRAVRGLGPDAGQILLYEELYSREVPRQSQTQGQTQNGTAGPSATTGPAGPAAPTATTTTTASPNVAAAATRAGNARELLTSTGQDIAGALRSADQELTQTRQRAAITTQRALYELQANTAELRNRLGRLYLDTDRVDEAIVQLEIVRAVDTGNLDTLFVLAGAYQQQGRWRRALDQYTTIYAMDPTYRNVAALHNQIARANSDSLIAGSFVSAEPARTSFGTRLAYRWLVNSVVGIDFGLDIAGTRIRQGDDPLVSSNDAVVRRQYFEQGRFTASVPLSLLRGRLVVTPTLGLDMSGNQLFFVSDSLTSGANLQDAGDFFQNWQFEPVYGASIQTTIASTFASLSWLSAPYRPTQDLPARTALLQKPAFRSQTMGLSLSTNLQNRPSPFWSRFALITGGVADLIDGGDTSGQRYAVQQDVAVALFAQVQPFTRIETGIRAAWEDYQGDTSVLTYSDFYRPSQVLQVGGFASSQLYRAVADDTLVIGVIGRVDAGLYRTAAFESDAENALRGAADIALELTRRNVAFQLGSTVTRVWDGDTDTQDFYSVGVRLDVVIRNPRLLTP